jgi:hypothetical protein
MMYANHVFHSLVLPSFHSSHIFSIIPSTKQLNGPSAQDFVPTAAKLLFVHCPVGVFHHEKKKKAVQ